jgi:hypothetical protein
VPGDGTRVTIIEIPAKGLRFRRVFAHLQLRPPAFVPEDRWQMAIMDGGAFLAQCPQKSVSPENCKLEHRRHVGPELGKAAMNFTRRPNAAAPTEPRIACHASEAEHRNR